jgi:hypothetical protein
MMAVVHPVDAIRSSNMVWFNTFSSPTTLSVGFAWQGLVQHTSSLGQGPLSGGRLPLLAAVGEKLLISLADYFIISNTGFGRLAAIHARRWNSIYTMEFKQTRNCHLEGDSYEDLSKRLPGVKHF